MATYPSAPSPPHGVESPRHPLGSPSSATSEPLDCTQSPPWRRRFLKAEGPHHLRPTLAPLAAHPEATAGAPSAPQAPLDPFRSPSGAAYNLGAPSRKPRLRTYSGHLGARRHPHLQQPLRRRSKVPSAPPLRRLLASSGAAPSPSPPRAPEPPLDRSPSPCAPFGITPSPALGILGCGSVAFGISATSRGPSVSPLWIPRQQPL